MGSFFKGLGHFFAKVAVLAAKGAVAASEHPEVVGQVVTIAQQAGVPQSVVDKVNAGVAINNQIVGDVKQVAAIVVAAKTPPAPGTTN